MTDTGPEDSAKQPPPIKTGGGAYIDDGVRTEGGDFVGRDKVINLQVDFQELINSWKKVRGENDPTMLKLVTTLNEFRDFHVRLHEWKELHNYINDILIFLGQFIRKLQRLEEATAAGNRRELKDLWRPAGSRVQSLTEWAQTIRYIDQPYQQKPDGSLVGPRWAVELETTRQRVETLLEPNAFNFMLLYDAAFDFNDAVERHMHQADKRLRDTATELHSKSEIVLGNLSDVKL